MGPPASELFAVFQAVNDVKLWAIARNSYRRIIMDRTIKKRQLYESFLEKVPILGEFEKVHQYDLRSN